MVSNGSSVEEVFRVAREKWVVPDITTVGPFYDDPDFIRAFAEVGRAAIAAERPDHVLMSFHGLPERHMTKAAPESPKCLKADDCCASIRDDNRHCYRAQCYATARALAAALGLGPDGYSVSFQSRLGRDPWIRPHTDVVVPELARAGKKRVLVFCPAFVADCLETLEEIGMRARDDFRAAGGESLTLVPSLNSSPAWVDAVVKIARSYADRIPDRRLGGRIFRMLEAEFRRTCRVVLRITGERRLLDGTPVLQRSIAVRNPYVDPMSYLQVELLARKRAAAARPRRTRRSDDDKLLHAVLLTINGIASGMRNTG